MSSKPVIRNFLFHRVSPQRDELWDPIDPALFEKCIRYISSHYKMVQAEQLPGLRNEIHKYNYATISFDDGYKDNMKYALPILDKYDLKASFYITTSCIDKNIPTWTHLVEYLLQHTQAKKITLGFEFIPDGFLDSTLNSTNERITYARRLIPYLKIIRNDQRKKIITTIVQACSDVQVPELMMSWDDLKELYAQGHYIGSHSVTHPLLEKMEDENEIRAELLDSGNAIQQHLGYFPITFAYPIGSYNARIIQLCKTCGYTIGLATKQDVYDPQRDGIFEIPRIELPNEPWWKTRMRISNLLEDVKRKINYRTHLLLGFGLYELFNDAAISY